MLTATNWLALLAKLAKWGFPKIRSPLEGLYRGYVGVYRNIEGLGSPKIRGTFLRGALKLTFSGNVCFQAGN